MIFQIAAATRWRFAAVLAACAVCLSGAHAQGKPLPPDAPARHDGRVRLDEAGLVRAVGKPVVRTYALDDGRGLMFRTDKQPRLSLEFRSGRINLSWAQWRNESGANAINAENVKIARQTLVYALGERVAGEIMRSVEENSPLRLEHQGHSISVMPGDMQTLVTVRRK